MSSHLTSCNVDAQPTRHPPARFSTWLYTIFSSV